MSLLNMSGTDRHRVVAGGPPTLPTVTAPLHFQADAQAQTASNGAALTQLTDQSGNARHATKTAGTLTYSTSGINSHGGFNFAAGAYCTGPTFTAIPSTTAVTIFGAAQFTTTGTRCLVAAATPTFTIDCGMTGTTWLASRGANVTGGTQDTNPHRVRFFLAASGASTSYAAVDGTIVAGPGAAGSGAPTSWRIGSSSSGFENFAGFIGEILIYAGALTGPETTAVESYLSTKWGI